MRVTIFVLPPSFDVLEQRLRARSGRDATEAQLAGRLETARREVGEMMRYDYVVVNDDLDRCVAQMRSIVEAERARTRVVGDEIARIVTSFETSES